MRWASAPPTPAPPPGHRNTPTWVAAGFALGALAGWLLGEWTGGLSRERITGFVSRRRPETAAGPTPRERVRTALQADPDLRDLGLHTIPAGRTAIELHGWVPSRRLRARATRLAATAAGTTRLIDCLLVRGEDDRPAGDTLADTTRSA
jgi:hypothetical protein